MEKNHKDDNRPKANQLFTKDSTIAVYTVLSLLIRMRRLMGLEAMLEYIDKYLKTVEKEDPRIKHAVNRAMTMISVEKIQKEVLY